MLDKQDKISNKIKMKKSIFTLILLILMNMSCTDTNEPVRHEINVKIRNLSSSDLLMECYTNNNLVIVENVVSENSTESVCFYRDIDFAGLVCFDSIVLKFTNNKGYVNVKSYYSDGLNFSNNRYLFGTLESGYTNLGNHTYQFTITEEDYLNAHDLP